MTKAESTKLWEKTPAGRESRKRYEQSAKGRASRSRRKTSAAYRVKAQEWAQTESGKASRRKAGQKYQASDKGRATQQRCNATEYGKERLRRNKHLRRARGRGVVSVERIERSVVYARDKGICQECGKLVLPTAWEMDHIVPLGPGSHTYGNVRCLCRSCNRKKIPQDKAMLAEWREVMP